MVCRPGPLVCFAKRAGNPAGQWFLPNLFFEHARALIPHLWRAARSNTDNSNPMLAARGQAEWGLRQTHWGGGEAPFVFTT
jgi:hypothetical protein